MRAAIWAVVGALVASLVFIGVDVIGDDDNAPKGQTIVALGGGSVKVDRLPSGWRIGLDAPQLERVDGASHYAAYLEGPSGRVAVGTFNDGDDVTLWAGVSPKMYPRFVVVIEPEGREVTSTTIRLED